MNHKTYAVMDWSIKDILHFRPYKCPRNLNFCVSFCKGTVPHKYSEEHERCPYFISEHEDVYDEKSYVGWSLCHKNDQFDKGYGETLAIHRVINRTLMGRNENIMKLGINNVPNSIQLQFRHFFERAKKYFKGDKIYYS